MKIPTITFWASDFGDIRLPDDFPLQLFRKDGWWDMRFASLREKWEAWITAEEAKLIPNRLHGATINVEGDAI